MSLTASRVALITGAAGGIGQVTAQQFAQAGYRLALLDQQAGPLAVTVDGLRASGFEVRGYVADQRDAAGLTAAFSAMRNDFGRLDAAFNNAGVPSRHLPLHELTDEEWGNCLDVNLNGTWRCMREEIRWMLDVGGGCIVNNASVYALNGGPSPAYTASKHGIAGLTKTAALQYAARSIRVNAVCPALVTAGMGLKAIQHAALSKTDLLEKHPAGRAASAEEVARAVLWLCSPDADFIHGHMLALDGGYGAR